MVTAGTVGNAGSIPSVCNTGSMSEVHVGTVGGTGSIRGAGSGTAGRVCLGLG